METYLFNFTAKKAGVYHTELSFCENLNREQKIFCVIYEYCNTFILNSGNGAWSTKELNRQFTFTILK